ncbi:nucleotidyltransferase domain-containing protein [Candidatus Marithrix sp. Canyon 246]|nr:nucleotidyltransferase domain-containing protein [Candidatus Marithrix sp. Canyon 246]
MKFGLKEQTINKIIKVFQSFPEIEQVILYGSRAKGTNKHGSDIDLTIKGKNLNLQLINKINLELDDLLLPYTFDVSIYNQIDNSDLLEHIKRVGKEFYHCGCH